MTSRPRLLDLFCGAGGAAVGYHRAGFDVYGVDIFEQPDYPYTSLQGDATRFPLDGFDAIHASPPCQDHSMRAHLHPTHGTGWMLDATFKRLAGMDVPWIVENVANAKGPPGAYKIRLCGSMFGLPVRRHRWFWSNTALLTPSCRHRGPIVAVYGHAGAQKGPRKVGGREAADALGIGWTTRSASLTQAIPPAYTEHVGAQLIGALSSVR